MILYYLNNTIRVAHSRSTFCLNFQESIMLRWLVSMCACSLLLAAPLAAQEKLAFKVEPGRKATFHTETKTDQTLTIAGMDLPTKVTVFQTETHTIGQPESDGSIKEIEKVQAMQVDMQLPGGLSFNFDSGNPSKKADNALLEPIAELFRVICEVPSTTTYDKSGELKSVELPAEAVARVGEQFQKEVQTEKLTKQTKQQRQFLPSDPVKPGDKWEVNAEAGLGGGQTFFLRTEYQYIGVVEKNGKKLHRITSKPLSVTYAMDADAPSPLKVTNSDLKIADGDGEILFDNERGMTVSKNEKSHITGDMTFTINGQELPGKLDLTMNVKSTLQ